jgi:hypothetical protein
MAPYAKNRLNTEIDDEDSRQKDPEFLAQLSPGRALAFESQAQPGYAAAPTNKMKFQAPSSTELHSFKVFQHSREAFLHWLLTF